MAKILFLSHRVPYPPNKGDKIRSYNEICYFSKRHEIHLLAFCDNYGELVYAEKLRKYCQSVELIPLRSGRQRIRSLLSMLRREPWTLGYYAESRMRNAVRERIGLTSFDILFAYSSSMAPYLAQIAGIPKVIDFVDSDASKWRQYASFKPALSKWLYSYESDRLAVFEESMVRAFDRSVFVSPREAFLIKDRSGKIAFIQNGIDVDRYALVPEKASPPYLIFVGAMDYFPNVDAVCFFAREIMPRLRKKRDIRFLIVGTNPAQSVRRLAGLPGITVTGAVDDVKPYLEKSSVAVVPNRIAQGIQNKILEALAAGLPVVTTTVAARGITDVEGFPIGIADDPSDFADATLQFLERPPEADQLRICRDRLKKHYSWETNLSVFDRLFEQLAPKSDYVCN